MNHVALVATALLGAANAGSRPVIGEHRADYLASAVVYAAGYDLDRTAALIVNLKREGGFDWRVEACGIPGIGGWGAWGLNDLVEATYPGTTCGPIGRQAKTADLILWKWKRFDPNSPAAGFGRYIGAHLTDRHPDARTRAAEFIRLRSELEHRTCGEPVWQPAVCRDPLLCEAA